MEEVAVITHGGIVSLAVVEEPVACVADVGDTAAVGVVYVVFTDAEINIIGAGPAGDGVEDAKVVAIGEGINIVV